MTDTNNKHIQILYEDTSLVVITKPGGLLSVPGRGADKQDCVTTRLQALYPEMIAQPSVHRLDMYTSGLMVVAITKEAHRHLSIQFENRSVKKEYTAVLEGKPTGASGEIQLPFRVDLDNRPIQIHDPIHGKMGITFWQKIRCQNTRTRVKFTPITGRTHQLRVHAAHTLGLGCPIVGDSLYGSGKDGDQMMLHASYLEFSHPDTGHILNFTSAAPF